MKCSNPLPSNVNAEPLLTPPERLIDEQQPSTSTVQEDILEANTNKNNVTEDTEVIAADVDSADPAT